MAWLDPASLCRLRTPCSVSNSPCFSEDGVSTTWRTFLTGHASELWTMDLTTQPLWNYSLRYVLVLMELQSRRVVHVAVTASPTLAWIKQRIREATPFGSVPRFLVHDNDGIFGQFGTRRPDRSGRSYRSALDLWLGEVLCIKGIPIPTELPMRLPADEVFAEHGGVWGSAPARPQQLPLPRYVLSFTRTVPASSRTNSIRCSQSALGNDLVVVGL